jgi:DNA-binding transcriptional LysR family regulator
MRPDPFDGLAVFLAVAERKSFTAAAASLGVSPAAMSQAVRSLESRLGLPLFQRTTRRVGLTEAGSALLARVRPAAGDIVEAIDGLAGFRDRPAGLLRLSVPRLAVGLVIEPVLPIFRSTYPDVSVEIAVEDATIDLTERGFDAGLRIGEYVERDMIAVRLTRDIRWCIVGAPAYLAKRGRPRRPADLAEHDCIAYRFPSSGALYRWELEEKGRAFSVDPGSAVIVNDGGLGVSMALAGLGLNYTADLFVAEELRSGRLARVLDRYLPTTPGLFLYFPARAQAQPKLRAFIDLTVATLRKAGTRR